MKQLALCLLFACGSSQPVTPSPAAPAPADPVPADPSSGSKLGDPCGEADACGSGQTCVAYYGVAGPRGPQFKSCEIQCKSEAQCPAAHRCITIADGPGQVCRP